MFGVYPVNAGSSGVGVAGGDTTPSPSQPEPSTAALTVERYWMP